MPALLIAGLLTLANYLVWWLANPPLPAADVPVHIAGLAYNAYGRWESPLAGDRPGQVRVAADLALLARHTDRLRTYSAAELPELPALAMQHGMRLTLGVWLDQRADNNARELAAALEAARSPAVERVIAGNETQLHQKLAPATLQATLDQLRKGLRVPVSTAEPWHVWLAQPELAHHVDFITVHLLPYWEGVPVDVALELALQRYDALRRRFPDKPIVIGEIGWPGHGEPFVSPHGRAEASPLAQARFVREFLASAAERRLDYYLMEAIDQPWKRASEGAVGAHWGLFDAARMPKFSLAGPLHADPWWQGKAVAAAALGFIISLPCLLALAPLRLPGRLAFALGTQILASTTVLIATLPLEHYLRPQDIAALILLIPALVLMAAIMLAQGFEFAELFWPGNLRRQAEPKPHAADQAAPLVSIHLACSNEPPETVIAAIDSLLELDWPALEILVVDNNTRDPALWRPLRRHVVQRLRERRQQGHHGPTLKFFRLPRWPGYKAGALNFALANTDPRAAWVGVIDADYLVSPDWLRQLAGHFTDPHNVIVQCPQAHRDWQSSCAGRMMNWEYEGFFRIGMHHRHERNAIIQHGTMTLIRRASLEQAGGWDEQCIVEDSELGLRLLAHGGRAIYVDRVFGTGLVPADFAAYCRQRKRWAQGAMQILRRHVRTLLGASPLTPGQRYHFIAGWLPWLGDALHLAFSLSALLWTIAHLVAPQHVGLPLAFYAAPLATFFTVRLIAGPLLYLRRVPCAPADVFAAALAGMGLSHSIARGVFAGIVGKSAIFHVTRRQGHSRDRAAGEETLMLLALLAAIAAMLILGNSLDPSRPVWLTILGLQALPYAAALACAGLSSRMATKNAGGGCRSAWPRTQSVRS